VVGLAAVLAAGALAAPSAVDAAFDPYAVLGVERDASLDSIKQAFRRLSRTHHPDVARGQPKEGGVQYEDISRAYEILSEASTREAFQVGAFHSRCACS